MDDVGRTGGEKVGKTDGDTAGETDGVQVGTGRLVRVGVGTGSEVGSVVPGLDAQRASKLRSGEGGVLPSPQTQASTAPGRTVRRVAPRAE